jgi:sigma-B regulation protein RsbU (phosphoserine phosphatase)
VYRTDDRVLTYGSAGHPPAYLVPADRQESRPVGSPALMIGAFPNVTYQTEQTPVPAGSSLYLFSDGLFEIVTKDQQQWALSDLLPLFLQPRSAGTPNVTKVSEAERVYNAVRKVAAPGPLGDDVSLLVVTFT